jgi:cytochrome c biogenesis protein CcdA
MQSITLFSLFLLGLSYGSTACMFSCMPFLSPLLVSNSQNVRHSIALVLPFSLGRVVAYTLIAMLAYSSAGLIKAMLQDNELFRFILGGFTLIMGIFLLYKIVKKQKEGCASAVCVQKPLANPFALFGMGFLFSINPCVPLLTLVALSAHATSNVHAIQMGIFFGFGAVLVPFFFYGFFLSTLMRGLLVEFKKYAKHVETTAALFLAAVGIALLGGQIHL